MRSQSGGLIQFGPIEKKRKPEPQLTGRRVCDALGCTTVLSMYNSSRKCWMHTQPDFARPIKN